MLPKLYFIRVFINNKRMRQLFTILIAVISITSCTENKEAEDFRLSGYYPISSTKEIKLNEIGKTRARAVWDSIRPMLKVDSTVHGLEYNGMSVKDYSKLPFIWLTFDYDSTYVGPSKLTFHMIADYVKTPVPTTYMYFGNSMVPCFDKFYKGSYVDTIDIILDRGLRRLIQGQGIRVDTDRGPTQKLSPEQVQALGRVMLAYEALSVLHNKYNYKQQ